MSALPPKADMCTAPVHVCCGPKADMCGAKGHLSSNGCESKKTEQLACAPNGNDDRCNKKPNGSCTIERSRSYKDERCYSNEVYRFHVITDELQQLPLCGWIGPLTSSIKSRRPQESRHAEVRAEQLHEQNRYNLQALAQRMNFLARSAAQAGASLECAGKNTCVYDRGEQR